MSNVPSSALRAWPVFRTLRHVTIAGLGPDVLAGLTLAAIAIPEQMATARLGGFAPQVGFFAFVAAAVGFAAFGSNRQLSAGADSTIAPIFAGSLGLLCVAGSAQYSQDAAMLALMIGVLLTAGGLFRLGWVANLLSTPVITGFLAGIAVHIVLSQAPAVLGLPEESGDVYHRLAALWTQAGGFNGIALATGLGVFAVIFACEKLSPRIPGALIALAAATGASILLNLPRRGVATLGHLVGGFPQFSLPHLSFEHLLPLVGLAFIVTLVAMMQTALTSRSFSESQEADVAGDFIGVGAANLLAGLIGAFPVNASPPRTAIVAETGGKSQYAGLLAGLVVLLLAAFGAQLLADVPTAALGGVLLFVAQRIFHSKTFIDILRRTRAEFALAALTTLLIIALPIQTGVAIGVFLSLAHGVFTVTRARPIEFERVAQTSVWWPASAVRPGKTEAAVLVMGFQAPLSFLNADEFRRGMLTAIESGAGTVKLLVLEASSMVEIDFTAAAILSEVIGKAHAAGMDFAVARLESVRAQAAFDRFGLTQCLGQGRTFHSVDEALRALAPAASV